MILYVVYAIAATLILGVWIGIVSSIAYTVFKWLTAPTKFK